MNRGNGPQEEGCRYPALSAILAEEYGYLDAKHDMGYEPRPSGFEEEYRRGYRSFRRAVPPEPVPAGSYTHQVNWGWY